MSKPYDLERFVRAQQPVYADVVEELRTGRKRTHWMWFIFPQMQGLGRSDIALYYGVASKDEAKDYLAHPFLGQRLEQCTQLVLMIEQKTLNEIFGHPDDIKFHSSMTLFAIVGDSNNLFQACLKKYCGNQMNPFTLARLAE